MLAYPNGLETVHVNCPLSPLPLGGETGITEGVVSTHACKVVPAVPAVARKPGVRWTVWPAIKPTLALPLIVTPAAVSVLLFELSGLCSGSRYVDG